MNAMRYYVDHYSDYVINQNKRHEKARHPDRCKGVEDVLKNKKTCPEESIYQLGTIDEHASVETLVLVFDEFKKEFDERFGSNVHIIDWSLHMDEATPHIHERHVFDATNRYGEIEPKQEAALEELGFELPNPEKKRSKTNNRKVVFDSACRTMFLDMEKKGIISDRCELNRQIKADNALLRELKAAVKKLAQEVLHSLPELAKSMEFLRQKLLIFCYQLNHIRTGKSVIGKSVDAWNINLNRYSEVVDQIKETKRERTDLLAEKKELPFWNIPRKNELTARIAELTELLEELQSEKAILLDNMDCTEGKDVSKVRKKVALMEANLKELDEQEQKYSAELETALAEYAELKTQGEQFDPVELHDTRQELRPEMEQTAVQRVKEKYGDKYSHRTMDDSKRDVSRHLDEYAESQEIRQIQREREYQQRRQNKAKQERKKQDDWER